MTEAIEQYYDDHPDRYRMKHKNAIQNYKGWKREKYRSWGVTEYFVFDVAHVAIGAARGLAAGRATGPI